MPHPPPEFLGNVSKIYGKCDKNIWEMLQKYMGNVTQLYGKCVKYYMGSVFLGSDTQPILFYSFSSRLPSK